MLPASKNPLVTVLMSVYNGSQFLKSSIDSILSQTYKNFEFVIINDGSIDNTLDIIHSYSDSRIKIIQSEINLGVSRAKNIGLANSQGTYIAIADCDDISVSDRLETQVRFMEEHPEISACGSWIKTIGNTTEQICPYPVHAQYIKCMLLFCSGLAHPAAIIRRNALGTSVYYNECYKYAHDYDLWIQLATSTLLTNIPKILLHYRLHPKQISTQHNAVQCQETFMIQYNHLQALGLEFTLEEFDIHKAISLYRVTGNTRQIMHYPNFLTLADNWFAKLKNNNRLSGYYNEEELYFLLTQYRRHLDHLIHNAN
jgi:glycosyltransferase involved in cell wall biosynthesis